MKTFFTSLRALIYTFAFVLLWYWIAREVKIYDQNISVHLPEWLTIPGTGLMIGGGLIAISCVGIFVFFGKGTAAPFDAPRKFVAAGLYRFVRNPMYIGGWITLVGFGLYSLSISILLFTLAWLLLAHLFVLFFEEPRLEDRFGENYKLYKKSVNRWLPKMKGFEI